MSQQWPPAQPDGASGASSGPPDEQGTIAGQWNAGNLDATMIGAGAAPVPGQTPPCPRCSQPLDPGSRFCQSCGAEIGGLAPPIIEDEKPRPLWFAVALGWLILSALALFFLYSQAILVGSH